MKKISMDRGGQFFEKVYCQKLEFQGCLMAQMLSYSLLKGLSA